MTNHTNTEIWFIADHDSKWLATFKATGCHSPNIDAKQLNYWIGKPDNSVFKDMVDYCELVKEGLASNDIKRQKMVCCGGIDCTVSICVEQYKWTFGKCKPFSCNAYPLCLTNTKPKEIFISILQSF